MKLDVGCGLNKDYPCSVPQGDVNCDVQKPLVKIPNFVQCDAQYLPFKDYSFRFVYSSHVIEHVDNPLLMLSELLRISNGKVLIKTPHRLLLAGMFKNRFGNSNSTQHRCHFNKKWFFEALKKLGYNTKFKIRYSGFKCLPHQIMPIFRIPSELEIVIWKR